VNKAEFSKALDKAKSGNYNGNSNIFCGFALPEFQQIVCTLDDLASLIAYQCFYMSGGIDNEALNEIWQCKRKFLVIGG
jgi:hypothetical protein